MNCITHTQTPDLQSIALRSVFKYPTNYYVVDSCFLKIILLLSHTESKKDREPRNRVLRKVPISEEGFKGFPAVIMLFLQFNSISYGVKIGHFC